MWTSSIWLTVKALARETQVLQPDEYPYDLKFTCIHIDVSFHLMLVDWHLISQEASLLYV